MKSTAVSRMSNARWYIAGNAKKKISISERNRNTMELPTISQENPSKGWLFAFVLPNEPLFVPPYILFLLFAAIVQHGALLQIRSG